MNYPFILKFSSITNLSDARYAAGAWADFAGFCFDPSLPEYLEPDKAKEIAGWINGPLLTGEFGQQPLEWIQDFVKALGLQAIQIPADHKDIRVLDLGLRIIVLVDKEAKTELMEKADLFITEDPQVYVFLKSLYEQPVILCIDNFVVDAGDFDGISLKGVTEDKPGTRDHAAWNHILAPYI